MARRARPPDSTRPAATAQANEPARKRRLDALLVELGIAPSREKAQALIMAGSVLKNGEVARRAAELVDPATTLSLKQGLPYASRGGYKLAGALDRFGIDVVGRTAMDVGASTGGFTDVLLQRGSRAVYAVDVGYGQLELRLRSDPRVVVLDRTNIRFLEALPEPCDLATIDVSFISLRLVIPPVRRLLRNDWDMIALVKPQFEAGRERVGRGGVVRDPRVHRDVLLSLAAWSAEQGLHWRGLTASPITGAAGNVEFLLWVSGAPGAAPDASTLVESALAEAPQSGRRTLAE
ncbi:MAG: TlyA family RNA methyltransferase [Chloroflexi bacterium]|nr:TlyA family RNA methyltransferase [Chloroflexota bacterium]